MAAWAKVKLFWQSMFGSVGSTLTATSEASGYPVTNVYSMLEGRMWKAGGTGVTLYLTYDAGAGNTKTADYLVIYGHNLGTLGAIVTLQHSTTGAWAGEEVTIVAGFVPASDAVILKEFTAPSAIRYWRVTISGAPFSVAPYIAICMLGLKTELDYVTTTYDPHSQQAVCTVNRSYGGVVAGIHTDYKDRSIDLVFNKSDAALYAKVKTWWDTHGVQQLFIAWDTANYADEVFLMYPEPNFNNPFSSGSGGIYRDIKFTFKGRVV